MDKSILKQFLKAGYVYNRHLNPTKAGTAQGELISPTLANITLDGMENAIATKYHTNKKGITNKTRYNLHKVNFVRYTDDFIVSADSEEVTKDIAEIIRLFLRDRGLELSREKNLISHIDERFDFLGWNFRKYKGKLLIKPSNKSIETITKSISNVIKKGKALSHSSLIKKLSPITVGWSEYNRSVVAKEAFNKLDFRLWNMLWTLAKRLRRNKSHQWIVNRYWRGIGSKNWVFSAEGFKLKSFTDTKIIRHPCIKMDKNSLRRQRILQWENKLSEKAETIVVRATVTERLTAARYERVVECLSCMKETFTYRS